MTRELIKRGLQQFGLEVRRVRAASDNLFLAEIPFAGAPQSNASSTEEASFTDSLGRTHLLDFAYSYRVKPRWKSVGWLRALAVMDAAGLLDAQEHATFRRMIGVSTISAPVAEIKRFAMPVLARAAELFEAGDVQAGIAALTDASLQDSVRRMATQIRADLASFGLSNIAPNAKVLDVGCGRGVSTAAFAELGASATGIDNDYSGSLAQAAMPVLRRRLQHTQSGRIEFLAGDIRSCPEIASDRFDLIYSVSCLEHVDNLEAALSEMTRLLKPGGAMIHRLNPFWSENGGHALGTLDAPWLHAMLPTKDFYAYIQNRRQHEAEVALPWINEALVPQTTIARVQKAILGAGLDLVHWREEPRPFERRSPLSSKIAQRVFEVHSDVTLADLAAENVSFRANKPSL